METLSEIDHEFLRRCFTPSDINEHLPLLFALASQCDKIVEFGVRTGNSTVAFPSGLNLRAGTLISYDINPPDETIAKWRSVFWRWIFVRADTAHLEAIDDCDLLFIDTVHTDAQIAAELAYHRFVRRWIVIHDTVLFWKDGEGGTPGIGGPIIGFLQTHPEWRLCAQLTNNNGMMVLERIPEAQIAPPSLNNS